MNPNAQQQLVHETILIIGGSGSLGNQLIQTYLSSNRIVNYSRDENKHWAMDLKYQSKNLTNVIGDIRDATKIRQTLLRHRPTIVIIAAALKHIDRCEYEINESINTNIIGIQNILDTIETNLDQLTTLKTVCFISTDKACSPVNVYGMCKSICEGLMVEKAKFISSIKFVCVRYGNVLNSRGSIIPILETRCESGADLTLTSDKMTRFIMTLEESVKLIEYSIVGGASGEIIVPHLRAMRIADLFDLFAEKYDKTVKITGLRSGEKIHESLINETQALRTKLGTNRLYYHIKPSYNATLSAGEIPVTFDHYHSGLNNISKEELLGYLSHIGLFNLNNGKKMLKNNVRSENYQQTQPYPYTKIDRFLTPQIAYEAQQEILQIPDVEWDRYQNPFEGKWTLRDKNSLPATVQSIFDELQSESFVTELSKIVGTELSIDTQKHYWGIHKYDHNDYLKIHVDAGIHPKIGKKKHVTLGIYLSHCWREGNGCDLEIWSGNSAHLDDAKLEQCVETITPLFNRAIIFTNTDNSWHGNPEPSHGTPDAKRIFLTISYLSDQEDHFKNKRTRAFFRPRPAVTSENTAGFHQLSLQRASEQCAEIYLIKKASD